MSTPLHYETAGVLVRRLRERSLKSIDLLEHLIERIEALDGPLNAVVARDFDRARRRAAEADRALDAGDRSRPLLGLPMTIKDTHETEGLVTASGAPELASHIPSRNADCVQRVVDAGAIFIGKTNIPLYAGDCQSFNEVYGTTNNPWNTAHTPGGSSGGAAAALAAGFTPLEIGSDIGGSIRNPSNYCGVYGHKPTWDIVSPRGHIPGPPGAIAPPDLAVVGPMARSAEDLGLMLDVLAGPPIDAPRGSWKLDLPPARTRRIDELRIAAWLDDPYSPVDRSVTERLSATVSALEAAGATVDVDARPEVDFATSFETYLMLLHPIIAAGFPPSVLAEFEAAAAALPPDDKSHAVLQVRGAQLLAREWLIHDEMRHQFAAAWSRFFERYDIVLMPTTPTAAVAHDHNPDIAGRTIEVNGQTRPYLDFLNWIHFATAGGFPATIAPVGQTADGLPVGIQIMGERFEDYTTIEAARMIGEIAGGFVVPPDYA